MSIMKNKSIRVANASKRFAIAKQLVNNSDVQIIITWKDLKLLKIVFEY